MILDTQPLLIWREKDTISIDYRAMEYLDQWLTHDEIMRLARSLSASRIWAFNLFLTRAIG